MLLTALVQTNGGTLVVELPRGRMDLEVKIRSIGIQKTSNQIHIIDDEDCDVSVKLFGESDIGKHLSLLFGENDTLLDVNKALLAVENSIEDIRDDLELNIIHDQYDSLAELVGDIEKMTNDAGQFTETFYFPLTGKVDENDGLGQCDAENSLLQNYESDIRQRLQREQLFEKEDGVVLICEESAKSKITSYKLDVAERSDALYGKVIFTLREPFTENEKAFIKGFCIGRTADILEEQFAREPIATEDGDIYISSCNEDGYYFMYDEDELNDYLTQQGGMTYQ